ncbi:hypothetical protein QBC38DRAFT_412204 [Podospora fimiseda]|uniref:3-carboxymuconate cyclase n=1 Tax=Podospora fimiseda TaxID=252190 RepID=A0AAN7BU85_9PEZI|nr:hypothetical protein QBC38DRAFT_412204 [Podospora fimiseda]
MLTDKKALYFLTNNEDSNSVACIEISSSGKITGNGAVHKTRGKGAKIITSSSSSSSESLFSQSSITVTDDHVFVVNPGSHTLSMLSIDPSNPINLKLVGQPIKLPGEFPTTVSVSKKHKLVCVGLTGAKAGISCSPYAPNTGLGAPTSWHEFKSLNQTTPPTGPYNTISQVTFSPDEKTLYATVKGDPRSSSKAGWLSSFPILSNSSSSYLSEKETRSTPQGTTQMSGYALLSPSKMLVTDPSLGGIGILSLLNQQLEASLKQKLQIPNQKSISHVSLSPGLKQAWISDSARNKLVSVSYSDSDDDVEEGPKMTTEEIDLEATGDSGFTDLKSGGDFLYALSPGDDKTDCGITVVNARDKKVIQRAGLSGVGASKESMGMAVWGKW